MRGTTLRHTLATAAGVTLLTLSAACGGGDGESGRDGARGGETGTGTTAGAGERTGGDTGAGNGGGTSRGTRPLTEAQLVRALLTTGEVRGYTAQRNTREALPPENTMAPDRPECEAITDTVDSRPRHRRLAYASGIVTKGRFGGAVQQVLLAAYRPGEAAEWLTELETALRRCHRFRGQAGTGERADLEIEPGGTVGIGDQSAQFTMKDARGKDSPTVFTVVRAGDSTATFMSAGFEGHPVAVDRAVVLKQHQKLRAAATGP